MGVIITNEGYSLALGVLSVACWSVAEIPQIITNFKTKSTEGLSFAFLVTWIIGDCFNIFGCILEPATLPTQFYMAVLYGVTTLTLTSQSVYYRHIYPRLKSNRQFHKGLKLDQSEEAGALLSQDNSDADEKINPTDHKPTSSINISDTAMSSPIPLPALSRSHSAEQDSYYTSARFLSTGHTPTGTSLKTRWRSHIDAENSAGEPFLSSSLPTEPLHTSKTKNLFCVVCAVTLVLRVLNISYTENAKSSMVLAISSSNIPALVGRKILQVHGQQQVTSEGSSNGGIGTYMGWGMAVIYMGGRLPQICLNIRRGHVEGLNPLMFIFALLGNTTYVASILVHSLDWSKIFPNLPWLVDAGGCALLDSFILLQFMYFQYWGSRNLLTKHGDSHTR